MNEKILKVFQKHYSDVLSQAADENPEAESRLRELLIEKIEAIESDSSLWPDAQHVDPTSFEKLARNHSIDRLVISCMSSLENNKELAISSFPRLNLVLSFAKHSIESLQTNKQIPVLLKSLLTQMKLPLVKLILTQPEYISNIENSAFKLFSAVLDYIPIWKDESGIGFPTYTKLSQLLTFTNFPIEKIDDLFDRALQPTVQISINQTKRAIIFEKRLVETQKSIFVKERAEYIVATIIKEATSGSELPGFIYSMLSNSWQRILVLDYVRNDQNLFSEHLKTMVTLILSLSDEVNKQRIDWLISRLPSLNKELNEGFIRLGDEGLDNGSFFSELEATHIGIIENNNNSDTFDNSGSLRDRSNSDEEILRLKPNEIFFSGTEPTEDCIDEVEIEENTNSKTVEEGIKNVDLFCSMRDRILLKDSEFNFTIDVIDDFFNKRKQEQNDNNTSSLLDDYQFSVGDWFAVKSTETENQMLVKLILIDIRSAIYLFCDQDNIVTHRLSPDEFFDSVSKGIMNKFAVPEFMELGIKSCVKIMKSYLTEQKDRKKVNEPSENIAPKDSNDSVEDKLDRSSVNNELESTSNRNKDQVPKTKSKIAPAPSSIDIANLSVGSWIVFLDSGEPIKCKLAAKIASKSSLVFVDRSGKKVREIKIEDLETLHQKGDIELKSIEQASEKILESVISKTRNLKSDL